MAEQNPSRLWGVLERYPDANLDDGVGEYLESQGARQQDRLAEGLDYLYGHSTPAFMAAGLTKMGATLVIGHQEAQNITHTLDVHAAQAATKAPPKRILGYLNWPKREDRSIASSTRAQLDKFIQQNPHIPFGYFEGGENSPPCMGNIRGLASDMLQPLVDSKALMYSHDADLRSLSPTFDADLYWNYHLRKLAVAIPHVVHEEIPSHPNLNRVLKWFNDPAIRMLQGNYFDLGLAYGAHDYRQVGGYGPDYITETIKMTDCIADLRRANLPEEGLVSEATLVTSSRRIAAKLAAGVSPHEMWHAWGDFDAHEAYRDVSETDLHRTADISEELSNRHLRRYAPYIIGHIAMSHDLSRDQTYKNIALMSQVEAIRERLGGPEDMFERSALDN